jgi:hypothetical protein
VYLAGTMKPTLCMLHVLVCQLQAQTHALS